MGSNIIYPSGPASLFSAIARTSIFEASQVWSISVHGGKILPKEHNTRPVICQACRHTALTGAACKFIAGRFGPLPGGYVCIECVAAALEILRLAFPDHPGAVIPHAISHDIHPDHFGESTLRCLPGPGRARAVLGGIGRQCWIHISIIGRFGNLSELRGMK